jgi:dipeptidyl aminopeptidase/acylaminoacyl peptidase
MVCSNRETADVRRRTLAQVAVLTGLVCLLLGPLRAGEPMRLTSDGRLKFSPVFFKGGEQVVYVDLEKPELYRLQRLNLKTRSVEPLHPKATTSEFEPAVSADGRFYAFLRTRGTLSVGVVVHNVASGAEIEVPPGAGFSGLRSPALAPDGSRVAYSFADGKQHIYSANDRGEDRKVLTSGEGINTEPCYSPDGKRIAFSSTRDGNYEIYVMDVDGGNVRRLTHSLYRDLRPRFSPDGRRIAFTSHRDGNAEIYVMGADGAALRRLTDHAGRDDYPAWHPDGRRLVIVSERDGRHDLYLIDANE